MTGFLGGFRGHKPSELTITESNHSSGSHQTYYPVNSKHVSSSAGLATPHTQSPYTQSPYTQSPMRYTPFLDFSSHGLTAVPNDIPAEAFSINLSTNMLTQVPPSFGRTFSALNILDLSGNQLTSLPEEIGHLTNLRELYINKNALTHLPLTLGSMRNLEVLDVSENYIQLLDMSISRLELLRMLNISDNRLTFLPPYLGLLAQNLRILLVDGNPFDKHQRDLIEPILTIPSREAKKIAKAKEKSDKLRAKAAKNGSTLVRYDNLEPLHSKEYMAAVKKLIMVRLKRGRKQSVATTAPSHLADPRASIVSSVPSVQRTKSQSVQPTSVGDQASIHRGTTGRSTSLHSAITHNYIDMNIPPSPQIPQMFNQSRDSAVIPTEVVAQQMANLNIQDPGFMSQQQSTPDSSAGGTPSIVGWETINPPQSELNDYSCRELPPPPPAGIPTESAREVALNIAKRIATGTTGSNALTDQELAAMAGSYLSPTSAVTNSSIVSGPSGLSGRDSTYSGSGESHGSSMDDSASLIQDAAKVARVLWQLCDEWDLNPDHTEVENVQAMLAQQRDGNVRIDGASGIERVYRQKSVEAGDSQRMKILSELLVTEVTYVDTLKNVVGIFLNPMREAKILSETELREIFSNIEVILAFHNDHFLPGITYAISQQDMRIGDIFLHHIAHFKLYSTYTNNHDTSVKTLANVSSRRNVSSFIQNARYDVTQIGQVGLDGHLLTPVQRLPRYRMLLTDLLCNTPPSHPDHEPLYRALKELNRTIHDVNEKKRMFENQAKLRKIQDKVAGAADIPLITPHRKFKLMANFRLQILSEPYVGRSGEMSARRIGVGTVYRFFLFNDMILQCTIIMNKDLKVNRIYHLATRVAPAEVTCDSELRIVDSEGILYLKGDPSDLRRWAHEINTRLET